MPRGTVTTPAVDLADGQHLWDWTVPDGCLHPVGAGNAAAADTVLVMMACEHSRDDLVVQGDVVVVGRDDRTGRERWRFTAPYEFLLLSPDGPVQIDMRLRMSRDHKAAELYWFPRSGAEAFGALVDAGTGDVMLDVDDYRELPGLRLHLDRDLVVVGAPGDTYRSRTFDDRADVELPPICATGSLSGGLPGRVGDALVAHCTRHEPGPQSIAVASWTGGRSTTTIDVDLGPAGEGHTTIVNVLSFPFAAVVVADDVGRLVGLG